MGGKKIIYISIGIRSEAKQNSMSKIEQEETKLEAN